MEKATVNMTDWELYVHEEHYKLSGTADHHPVLGRNVYIAGTSYLVDYTFNKDVLIYETKNTIYVCPLKYMKCHPYRNVAAEYKEELIHRGDNSDSILDKIIAATAKLAIQRDAILCGEELEECVEDELLSHIMEIQIQGQQEIEEMRQRESKRLINIALNYEDCVYIEVSNVGCGSLLAYHLKNDTGVVEPSLHAGMFQDSVLYIKNPTKENNCSLDFRYFPRGWEDVMETYSWSDNIQQAIIKNDTSYLLRFNECVIEVGETKVFTPKRKLQG